MLPQAREQKPPESGFGEGVFSEAADGAYPIVRDVLEGGAGGDAAVRITDSGIIHITAGAFVLHHSHPFFRIHFSAGRSRSLIPSYPSGGKPSRRKKAFRDCPNLKAVTIATEQLTADSIGENVFTGIRSDEVICRPESKAEGIPDPAEGKRRGSGGDWLLKTAEDS